MKNSKLKEIRQALGLNQKDFAAKLNIKQSYYSALELGKKDINTSKVLQTLFNEIGVNAEWYFNSVGTIFNKNNEQNNWGNGGGNAIENILSPIKRKKSHDAKGYLLKYIDASTLTDIEILKIFTNQPPGIKIGNLSDERINSISKLVDKQKVIAEKVFNILSKENQQLDEFRKNILAIQGFENLLNDIIYNTAINTLIKIEDSAKHYSTLSFSEFKDALNADYAKFKPYASIFSELASAMKGFADKAKEIPEELIGIDKQEYDEYIALNT